MMNNFENIVEKLRELGVVFEVIEFPDEVILTREKDNSLGHNYDQKTAIKTLIVKTKVGLRAIILKGDQRIEEKRLEEIVGKWTVADSKILFEEFGFMPGTVCPLVLKIPILVDKQALEIPVWSMRVGDTKKGLNVRLEEIVKCLKFKTVKVASSIEEKFKQITRNCQEVLTEEDLKKLIESGKTIQHYIGFEISGMVHLGTGLMSMGKIADFLRAGIKCKIFLADFHSYLNNKLGGNWENIRWASDNYFKQALIASLKCFGVDESEVEFISGKKLYEDNPKHWETFMRVGKQITLSRNLR